MRGPYKYCSNQVLARYKTFTKYDFIIKYASNNHLSDISRNVLNNYKRINSWIINKYSVLDSVKTS